MRSVTKLRTQAAARQHRKRERWRKSGLERVEVLVRNSERPRLEQFVAELVAARDRV